ncbi:MAG: flagellar basal body L-ring protein FlgH [Synergistaceae bacterium]|jgi:flagellar L-ring protein precursor FlgH|nr:flagellar basal body L-ring protein FlgH [Synergistaceae bacterium]
MKMKYGIKFIAAVIAAMITAQVVPAMADSLWSDGSSLFADRKASSIGDILMVRVSEKFSDTDQGKTSSTKDTDEDIKAGTGILSFLKAFGFGTSSNMNGNTKVERTKKMDMLVSCMVTDVMPNGNMVIQGERSMVNGAERMNVRYSGVVRPQDVTHANTVDSSRVANAELICNGKGIITRTQRPGIINQILQAIF